MKIEPKRKWFVHRMYTNGETKLTIIWARNIGENINQWEYKTQILELDIEAVDKLE